MSATSILLFWTTAFCGSSFPGEDETFEKLVLNWSESYRNANDNIYFECAMGYPNPKINFKEIRREGRNVSQHIRFTTRLQTNEQFNRRVTLRNDRYKVQLDGTGEDQWRIASMSTKLDSDWSLEHTDNGIIQMGLNPYSILNMLVEGHYEIVDSTYRSETGSGSFTCKFDFEAASLTDIGKRGSWIAKVATLTFDLSIAPYPIAYEATLTAVAAITAKGESGHDDFVEREITITMSDWTVVGSYPIPMKIRDATILKDGTESGLKFELSNARPISRADRKHFYLPHYGLPEPDGLSATTIPTWLYFVVFGLLLLVGSVIAKRFIHNKRGGREKTS